MITLIWGAKGSGKTKRIIDSANDAIENARGTIVYITDKTKHSKEVKPQIRFVDTGDYRISGIDSTMGFIKGILSADNDLEKLYFDGLARVVGKVPTEMKAFYDELEHLSQTDNVDFCITVSCEVLPDFLKKYT